MGLKIYGGPGFDLKGGENLFESFKLFGWPPQRLGNKKTRYKIQNFLPAIRNGHEIRIKIFPKIVCWINLGKV
ncbi:MAG: hypothetical protein CM15mP58_16200 [Burkholderiaceae bacterium]|nr:MAG: hypothetical protein CM15mP58_16200 [Burkholderiaceae bacterium]